MPKARAVHSVSNAFSREFLSLLQELPEPETAEAADLAGPWKLIALDEGFGLFREWESPEAGDSPLVELANRDTGLLFLAVVSALARETSFRASSVPEEAGFAIRHHGEAVGHSRVFNDGLLFAAHVAEGLARSPWAMATLLQAAGPLVIEQVGKILGQEVQKGAA